jgi:hypothetical protein
MQVPFYKLSYRDKFIHRDKLIHRGGLFPVG